MSRIHIHIVLLNLALACAPPSGNAMEGQGAGTHADPGTTTNLTFCLEGLAPPGWGVQGAVERYTPATLYEKINGRSELYMAYTVASMAWVALAADTGDAIIEVHLYDMKTPLGAFGVFSMERSRGAPTIRLGRQAYHDRGNLFFWKGAYYATIRGPETHDMPSKDVRAVATHLAQHLHDAGEPLWGFQILPEEDLVADSVQYFMADALALDFMTDTFTAVYARPQGEATVFLSHQPTQEDAKATRDRFVGFLEAYGEQVERTQMGTTRFASADMGGEAFDVVFQLGAYVAGVTAVEGRDRALEAAVEFRDRLQGRVRDRQGGPARDRVHPP